MRNRVPTLHGWEDAPPGYKAPLVLEAPPFYTSPLPFWSMPEELSGQYATCAVVLTKGDANYRR